MASKGNGDCRSTAGQFRPNAELPIPFDGNGQIEVDLLCTEARPALELDGAQHLDSPEAYLRDPGWVRRGASVRGRDRRKHMLLQEYGYFVLRFLAEDVGNHLDAVLDASLGAMSHRMRRPSGGPEPDRATPDGP